MTATPSQGVCIVNVVLLSCSVGTIPPGGTVTVTVRTPVPADSTTASLTDVARVTSATSDPDPANNTAPATTDVIRNADLAITKSASPATVTPGGAVTYALTATNSGPSTATSVAITDTASDSNIVITAASTPAGPCPFGPDGARCTAPSIAPGGTVVMTVTGLVKPGAPPGSILANAANVSSATPDDNPTNDAATAQITVGPRVPGLTATKTAVAPNPLIAGVGLVRYTIDVANDGPSDADPVTAGDVLPAGFVVVSATTDRGDCTVTPASSGDTVSCALGALTAPFADAPGGRARITITAEVPAGVAGGTFANTATVQTPGSPPVASNDAPVEVTSLANVSVVKAFPQGADSQITPGTTETYRIRVVNDGPSVAVHTVVTDALPAGLTPTAWRVVSVTPPGPAPACTVATVTCDLGDLAPATTVELELDVLVDSSLVINPAVGVTNTATVSTASTDPSPGDNTSIFTAGGQAQADMSIRKLPPSPDREIFPVPAPIAGQNTSYVLEIINFGPSEAPNPVITEVLPPGMTFVRAFEPIDPVGFTYDFCTGDGGSPETVTCVLPFNFPASVGTHLGIEVHIDPTVRDGTVLTNTATIASDAADANTGNNSSTATISVRAVANLHVEKLVGETDENGSLVRIVPRDEDPLAVPPGHDISFFFQVTNDGPSAAADVQVRDQFQLDAAPLFGSGCDVLTGDVVCRYSNPATGDLLVPGDTFSSQSDYVANGGAAQGVYTNTVTASTSTLESTLADNTDQRNIRITDPITDLIIDKTAVSSPLVAGGTFTYQIAVRAGIIDLGPPPVIRLSSNADNVVVADTLPPGLIPAAVTSSQGTCTFLAQDVRCELGTVTSQISLDPVAPALVTVTGTVAPDAQPNAGADITNTATATTSTPLRGGGESVSSTAATPLTRRADLAITKAADAASVAAGGGITFTVTITNTGPSDATGVVATDLLPAPLAFDATGSDSTCSVVAGSVQCAVGAVAAGATRAIAIAATLPSNVAAGSVTNTASVTSDVADPDGTNNSASLGVDIVRAADLVITKTPQADGVLLGSTIAYTLAVANDGPSDATAAVLTESIPTGTTAVTLPAGCADNGAGTITCALGDIAAGAATSIDIVLNVPDTLAPGSLDNTASVTSGADDPNPADNTSSATVKAVAEADVTLTKELVTPDPVAGQPVEYRLTLVNHGPTVAPNASLSDPIPTGSTFVSFTASQGTCQLDPVEDVPAASCSLGRLAVGATATATLIVATDPAATSITNTGFGGSGGLDVAPADNEATATNPLRGSPTWHWGSPVPPVSRPPPLPCTPSTIATTARPPPPTSSSPTPCPPG